MIVMRILESDQDTILSGATQGRSVALRLAQALPRARAGEPVVLDFEGVEVATASFLREAVLGFRQLVRRDYPVILVRNASGSVVEDLREVLMARGEVLPLLPANDGSKAEVIGSLDPKLSQVLETLAEMGGATAGTLAERCKEDAVKTVTAWNNRLSTLAELGLVYFERRGRAKHYFSALSGC